MRKPDPLIVLILLAVGLAILFPASGTFADVFATATKVAIALLFFLYGARLSTQEALAGLKHWRLHLVILGFTFVAYPLIALALGPALRPLMGEEMYLGVLYLSLVPSTVQSSVAFTSIARGNVAGAIVSASASNLVGVLATPLLVMLLMPAASSVHPSVQTAGLHAAGLHASGLHASGLHVDAGIFIKIALLLLLPFVLGQLSRRWLHGKLVATKLVDRSSIAMVVYSAFSAGVTGGIWSHIGVGQIVLLAVFAVVFVALMLWLTRFIAARLGFSRADQIAIEFCGSKKSLATGLPMASVIFGAGGAQLALLVLPLMIYHQVQLMMCSWLAARYSEKS